MATLSVLLVDDTRTFLRILTAFLSEHGEGALRVVGSVGGREAVAQAETLQPEVVLRRGQPPRQGRARRRDARITSGERRDAMKERTKDAAKGTLHQVKGTVKETVGRATNNPDLEAEGQAEKIGGKLQKKIGHVKKVPGK